MKVRIISSHSYHGSYSEVVEVGSTMEALKLCYTRLCEYYEEARIYSVKGGFGLCEGYFNNTIRETFEVLK